MPSEEKGIEVVEERKIEELGYTIQKETYRVIIFSSSKEDEDKEEVLQAFRYGNEVLQDLMSPSNKEKSEDDTSSDNFVVVSEKNFSHCDKVIITVEKGKLVAQCYRKKKLVDLISVE